MSRRLAWSLLILLSAAVLRLVALRDIPPGLAQDEVLDADIAQAIRAGQFALFFREGYGHEPLYHYLAAPFGALLGDNFLASRLPSVFLGLLLTALALVWARREYGAWAAAVMGIGLSVNWWPIIFSRIGIRPILEPLLLLLMAWAWPRRPVLAGLWLGLACYSYTPAVIMLALPVAVGLSAWLFGNGPDSRRQTGAAARWAATAGLVYLPLFLTLRAHPELLERVNQLSGPITALRAGDWRPILHNALATLGVFSFSGDPRWTYMWPGRPLLDIVAGLAFYAGLLICLRRWRAPAYRLPLLWLGLGLTPSIVTPDAPSAIRLIGALPAVFVLPGIAVAALQAQAARRLSPAWAGALGAICLALLAGVGFGRTYSLYLRAWPLQVETRLKYQSHYLDIARAIADRPGAPVVNVGFFAPIEDDTLRRDLGRDPQARWAQQGQALIWPVESAYLIVPETAPLQPGLATALEVPETALVRSLKTPGFAIYALPPQPDWSQPGLPVTFDGKLALLGYRQLPRTVTEPARWLTCWRVLAPLPDDLAIFVHGVSAEGRLDTQHDGLDAVPGALHPGDVFVQWHELPVPTAPLNPYTVSLGLYRRNDGQRWGYGAPAQDTFPLASVSFAQP